MFRSDTTPEFGMNLAIQAVDGVKNPFPPTLIRLPRSRDSGLLAQSVNDARLLFFRPNEELLKNAFCTVGVEAFESRQRFIGVLVAESSGPFCLVVCS